MQKARIVAALIGMLVLGCQAETETITQTPQPIVQEPTQEQSFGQVQDSAERKQMEIESHKPTDLEICQELLMKELLVSPESVQPQEDIFIAPAAGGDGYYECKVYRQDVGEGQVYLNTTEQLREYQYNSNAKPISFVFDGML